MKTVRERLQRWEPVLTVHSWTISMTLGAGGLAAALSGYAPTWDELLRLVSALPVLVLFSHVLAFIERRDTGIHRYREFFAARRPSEKHPLLLYLILSFALLSFAALLQLPNSLRRGSFDTFGLVLLSFLIAVSFLLDWRFNKFKAIRLLFP